MTTDHLLRIEFGDWTRKPVEIVDSMNAPIVVADATSGTLTLTRESDRAAISLPLTEGDLDQAATPGNLCWLDLSAAQPAPGTYRLSSRFSFAGDPTPRAIPGYSIVTITPAGVAA